ncbi:uncharacterized protein ACRADG_009087 [Cochliomyia hominivorax]
MSGFYPKDLIHEVKIRPGLYNREVLKPPRREQKHQLWLEVAENLTPAEEWQSYTDVEKEARMDEITTKWKHLKDNFYRELKLQEAGEANKKRKYVYFDDMEFMRPYVGYKVFPNKNKGRDSMDETADFVDNDSDIDMDTFLKSSNESTSLPANNSESDLHTTLGAGGRPKRLVKPTLKAMENKSISSTPSRVHKEVVIKNFNVLKKTGGNTSAAGVNSPATNPSFKLRDGDISFCLSLVPTLRKLGDSRKLRAKIDILQVLHRYIENNDKRNVMSMRNNSKNNNNNSLDQDDDIAEDHWEEYEEGVNVKSEHHDDPLNGGRGGRGNGNTKAWWT